MQHISKRPAIMVDVVSIIIAVVSLVGSLAAVGFTGWMSFYIDRVKKRDEAKELKTNKYRDPLLLASYDLSGKLCGIAQGSLIRFAKDVTSLFICPYLDSRAPRFTSWEHISAPRSLPALFLPKKHVANLLQDEKKDQLHVYTAFLVGQYLSWTYILRHQAQFLRFATDSTSWQLSSMIESIANEFSHDRQGEEPFRLWIGQQMAIGELMTVKEESEFYCMGFATFTQKYKDDLEFKKWFQPIESGLALLLDADAYGNPVATYRLRRIQHRLADFTAFLTWDSVKITQRMKMDAAPNCTCIKCPGVNVTEFCSVPSTSKLPEP